MTCLTCAHWNLRDYSPMQRFGFGRCRLLVPPFKSATYSGPIHTCNRHAPADPRAIPKRKAMLP